jgi:hypothetical protein
MGAMSFMGIVPSIGIALMSLGFTSPVIILCAAKKPTAIPASTPIATAPTTKLLVDICRFMTVSPLGLN